MSNNLDDIDYQGVEIKLDKIRHLRYTFAGTKILLRKYGSLKNAIKEFEKVRNCGGDITEEVLDVLTTMVQAGLVHEDNTLTFEKVETILDFRNIMGLVENITDAFSNSMPDEGDTGMDTEGVEGNEKNPTTPAL